MPDSLFGLPTHILLLHIVVILLPIVAAATASVALSGRFRHRWGLTTVGVTFVVTLFVPLTSRSGESLAARLPHDAAIARHANLGQQVVIWAAAFGLCLFAVVAFDLIRRATTPHAELTASELWATRRLPPRWREETPGWTDPGFRVAQVLALATAIGVTVMVILAGHSGAQAVWSHYPNLRRAAGAQAEGRTSVRWELVRLAGRAPRLGVHHEAAP